jgi:hypothetical protein
MRLRSIVAAGVYASLVPLVGAAGPWGVVVAVPVLAVEAPGVSSQTAAPVPDAPIRAGRLETRDASAGVAGAIDGVRRGGPVPAWITYTVPAVSRPGDHGRWHTVDEACVLGENGFEGRGTWTSDATRTLRLFAKVDRDGIARVSFADGRCVVDAGSQAVVQLSGVRPGDSTRWLGGLIASDGSPADDRDRPDRDVRKQAVVVIALTDDETSDKALEGFVGPDRPDWLRRDAAFWLGAARGEAGAAVVQRLARTDRDAGFREHLTFVLTLTGSSGIDTLIDLARHDDSTQVRGQALFWLAQKAGQRAVATLDGAVDRDPDSEVRKRAVFAISQLPRDESVPMLIRLARTHRDPGVRQQAMFWLGQSGDARALAFFEEVLAAGKGGNEQ